MASCSSLDKNTILNSSHLEWPLFEGIIYGDATLCAKLSKRLVCGVKLLPLRLSLKTITNTQAAVEMGVSFDPTLFVNGKLLIEGLVTAEEITTMFEHIIKKGIL